MSEPFIAEVRIWGLNFAPRGWAFCDGQLLSIAQNTALFSLIGTTYGGDGRTTMGLPDLKERMPMHPGTGPGLSRRQLGQRTGSSEVTLTQAQMPYHSHQVTANKGPSNESNPAGRVLGRGNSSYSTTLGKEVKNLAAFTVAADGGGQPHYNQSPYLNLSFTIALTGLFPSRS